MGQRHVCTFRHALRAAYRTAISAAQILVIIIVTLTSRTASAQRSIDIIIIGTRDTVLYGN